MGTFLHTVCSKAGRVGLRPHVDEVETLEEALQRIKRGDLVKMLR